MSLIFKTEFGSLVYGTNLPSSDKDYKSIFVPTHKEIILQNTPRVISANSKKDTTQKNTADDVDDESMSLQYYLKLLAEGQTPCIDMLFAPRQHWHANSFIWEEVQRNRSKFLSKNAASFVGYCRTQANKYGIKGSRVAAMRETVEMLKCHQLQQTLDEIGVWKWAETNKSEFINIVMVDEKAKGMKPYLEVCNKKMPMNASVKVALNTYDHILQEYGHRALQAEKNEGVDFKALYHCVRVACEAEEMLLTGHITFPRPEAPLLLQIRKGEIPYKQLAEMIDEKLDVVLAAQIKSTLPEKPDYKFIDEFVYNTYLDIVSDYVRKEF